MDKIAFKINDLTPTKKIRSIILLIVMFMYNTYTSISPKNFKIIKYAIAIILVIIIILYFSTIMKWLFFALLFAVLAYLIYIAIDNFA